MSKMKKLMGLLVAMVMVLAMSLTVFAKDSTLTIATTDGHTYKVYQMLTGDVSELSNNGSGKLSNVELGTNNSAESVDKFVTAITGKSEEALSTEVGKYIKGTAVETVVGDGSSKNVSVVDGYYVVEDSWTGSAKEGETISRYMVAVVGDTTMSPKTSAIPTVVKKVKDTNDSEGTTTSWQDSADYDIGDSIPYQLTATLPEGYSAYKSYYLSFNDTLDAGLTLQASTIVVKVNGTALSEDDYYVYGTQNSFKVVIYDLKEVTDSETVTDGSTVTVEYSATLNSKAVIGSEGNSNEVTLTYSNNPNSNAVGTPEDDTPGTPEGDTPDNPGTPETPDKPGTTTPDVNVVFTYEVDANKVIAGTDTKLAGAAFELYKKNADGTWTSLGIQNATKKEDGTYTLTSDTATSFSWSGLDDGTYKIVEVMTPEGYNTIADQTFKVEATHDETSDDPQLKDLGASAETGSTIAFTAGTTTSGKLDGSLNTNIENNAGTVLPSTGGMGTTMIYLFGAILAIGAGVLLVAKKRVAR